MDSIKVGVIGTGFIGACHIETLRRLAFVDVVAISDANYDLAKKRANEYNIPKCYSNIDSLLKDQEIQVIHNCTPNYLHLDINLKVITSGKHIFCEKPLAMSSTESVKMLDLLKRYPNTIAGVNFCYRMTPLVQEMKCRIKNGELGEIYLVHGSYLQDWLLFDTDYNWRLEPEMAGNSRCVADIGSHWIDTAQTILGSNIIEVCANTETFLPIRKKPKVQVETFSIIKVNEYEEKKINTEDYASVMIKFENGARGVFQCSQVNAGRKNYLDIEVNGSKSSFHWNQETSDRMWKGNRNTNNEIIFRDPNFTCGETRKYSHLAAGLPEGWNDAFKNNLLAFYTQIKEGMQENINRADFASFEEGHYIIKLTEAILKSNREKRWVNINEI